MSNETRHAFFLGTEARRENSDISPYEVDDKLMYYWIKGRLGMQYRNQEVMMIKQRNNMLLQRLATVHARNAVPADELNTAKMNKALDELNSTSMQLSVADSTIASMQATINNLSAKLSKVAKAEKREANRGRL